MTPSTAGTLADFMTQVVDDGTGTAATLPGISVAGKTGTAETGRGTLNDAWFIGFAPAAQPPSGHRRDPRGHQRHGRSGGRADRRPRPASAAVSRPCDGRRVLRVKESRRIPAR